MTIFTIKHAKTGAILFSGAFKSMKQCLEAAVNNNTDLSYADLRHARLRGANLDGARLNFAALNGADCTGANLSEACLQGANFSLADLSIACLCDADMRDTNMCGTTMAGALVHGANITGARFGSPCALLLPFTDMQMGQNTYHDAASGTLCGFNRPPLVILSFPHRLVVFDTHIMLGNRLISTDTAKQHFLAQGARG